MPPLYLPLLRDHPRRCGENRAAAADPGILSGITPAGAGKTVDRGEYVSSVEDHPRRCGENFAAFPSAARTSGSPPQVRGKLDRRITVGGLARITPAGAGKTETCPVDDIKI